MPQITTYVLDNSVILKPILQEEGMDKVKKLFFLKDNFKISILVPDLFRYEFFNKVTKEKNMEIAEKAFQNFVDRQVSIIPLEIDLIEMANRLMYKYSQISFYDAVYHALAKAYHADLITADEKYYKTTKAEGNVRLLRNLKL